MFPSTVRFRIVVRRFLGAAAGLLLALGSATAGGEPDGADPVPPPLIYTDYQTAVLDPADWDRVIAGDRYFDAVRPMLVRFPGMAEAIHDRLARGETVERLELVLQWDRQEGPRPERGRHGWGADELYAARPGRWHVVVRPLLRPWSIDPPDSGPTFESVVRGHAFWDRGGARGDATDRAPIVFGPYPLHDAPPPPPLPPGAVATPTDTVAAPDPLAKLAETLFEEFEKAEQPPPPTRTARIDLTGLLNDATLGEHPGARLRTIEACGFQVHKHEIRDMSYRSFWAYDWAVSIGYLRIWVKPPVLQVTFGQPEAAIAPPLPPPVTPIAAAAAIGDPFPSSLAPPADHLARVARHLSRPENVPDWQWQRIEELRALSNDPHDVQLALGRPFNFAALFSEDQAAYDAMLRELLRMPPRTWHGHLSSDFAILPVAFGDLLPPAVMDHLRLYWDAWLHPETANRNAIGGGNQRGGPSYFRGYSHGGGTMNFGHNAVMGALLGGQLLEAPHVLRDARQGLAHLLRGWGLGSGAHQEIGDTFYQALSLGAIGAIARWRDDPADRLTARIHRDRLIEPLISMYHPGLRRTTHPMGRGNFRNHLLFQDGPYHVLHTLSPEGVLLHLDDLQPPPRRGTPSQWGQRHGLTILGDEGPPLRMALMAPWSEPWQTASLAAVLDAKTPPWTVHARDFSPGCRGGGWHVNHIGRHYALASRDNANHDYGITSVIAQWRRRPLTVTAMEDVSTLLLDFDRNGRFPAGNMAEFGVVQHGNKLMAVKGLPQRDALTDGMTTIKALHTTVAILAFGDTSDREVWINNRRIDELSGARPDPGGAWFDRLTSGFDFEPKAPSGPSMALGGAPGAGQQAIFDLEKELAQEWTPPPQIVTARGAVVSAAAGDRIAIRDGDVYLGLIPVVTNAIEADRSVELAFDYPALLIHAFVYRSHKALNLDRFYGARARPCAGFIIELADAEDVGSFEAFRDHLQAAQLKLHWDTDASHLDMAYQSGDDHLEMHYDPARYPARRRRINGQWPYLPDGILRRSPWAVQGSTGRLELHGTVLESQSGRPAYLQVIRDTGLTIAYQPQPAPNRWRVLLPDDVRIEPDGLLGMARIGIQAADGRLWIDTPAHAGAHAGDTVATSLIVSGLTEPPAVVLNDVPLPTTPTRVDLAGRPAYVIPLTDAPALETVLQRRNALWEPKQ